jgi:hypothetical protein
MATIVSNLPHYEGPISPETARRLEAFDRLTERIRETNKVEPLPDNFLDLCKGRASVAVYSK